MQQQRARLRTLQFLFMQLQILLLGSQSAPDVALRFIVLQNLSGLCGQSPIQARQAVRDVFMYRTLTHPKGFGGLSHRGIVFNNIIGDT